MDAANHSAQGNVRIGDNPFPVEKVIKIIEAADREIEDLLP